MDFSGLFKDRKDTLEGANDPQKELLSKGRKRFKMSPSTKQYIKTIMQQLARDFPGNKLNIRDAFIRINGVPFLDLRSRKNLILSYPEVKKLFEKKFPSASKSVGARNKYKFKTPLLEPETSLGEKETKAAKYDPMEIFTSKEAKKELKSFNEPQAKPGKRYDAKAGSNITFILDRTATNKSGEKEFYFSVIES